MHRLQAIRRRVEIKLSAPNTCPYPSMLYARDQHSTSNMFKSRPEEILESQKISALSRQYPTTCCPSDTEKCLIRFISYSQAAQNVWSTSLAKRRSRLQNGYRLPLKSKRLPPIIANFCKNPPVQTHLQRHICPCAQFASS